MTPQPLLGKTIAVPETRELERLTRLLREQGATPLAYPLIGIRDAADSAPIEAWLRILTEGGMDDLVLLTGEGVRRLAGFAERAGLLEPFVRELARVRTITRGPKPAAALHAFGIRPTKPARAPTADGIMRDLQDEDFTGRCVGLQLYAEGASDELIQFLHSKHATVHTVAPYVYVPASEDEHVDDLLEKIMAGTIDAIAFTSSAQVERVFQAASTRGASDAFSRALNQIVVAAVGPTCAASLQERGVAHPIMPERSFFMRSLVDELVHALGCANDGSGIKGGRQP